MLDNPTRHTEVAYVRVRAQGMGAPSGTQLDAIRERVTDPSILDEHPPFTWRVIASTDAIDAYFTRMAESSLRNYADDAKAGLAYLDSHYRGEQPLGMSYDGRYVRGAGERMARVEEDFYTLQGLTRGNGLSTDELIALLRSGISRDVSIGFYDGWYRCSICDRDMFPGWFAKSYGDEKEVCTHFPGLKYPKLDRKGNPTGEDEMAYAWVEDARQAECSSVYDGATPGAMVTKANALAESGVLKADAIRLLGTRLRVRIGGAGDQWTGWTPRAIGASSDPANHENGGGPVGTPHDQRDNDTDTLDDSAAPAAGATDERASEPVADADITITGGDDVTDEQIREILARAGAPADATLDWLADEVLRLRPLADDGAAYRTALVNEAIEEGVRALGEQFPAESQRAMLSAMPIEMIRMQRDTWGATAKLRFPGGRQTTDEDKAEKATDAPVSERRPDAAYQG